MKISSPIKRGKRAKSLGKEQKVKIIVVVSTVILLGLSLIIYLAYSNMKEKELLSEGVQKGVAVEQPENEIDNTIEPNVQQIAVDMPEEMKGYSVIGKIVIEKIGLEKYILNKTTKESLKESVTKFYGPAVNEVGNLCISGHNTKNMLKELKQLEVGDTFYLISRDGKKLTYQIDHIDKVVNPKDLSCLSQKTNQQTRVTIITCNPGGATRLVYKAKAI